MNNNLFLNKCNFAHEQAVQVIIIIVQVIIIIIQCLSV